MAELLQVVLSILSWIVGLPFFGAVITIAVNLARDYRQRKRELQREEDQRRRERTGLLTLLHVEHTDVGSDHGEALPIA
jgi:GAF domain-containing protein